MSDQIAFPEDDGRARRDEAMGRADAHADKAWKEAALDAVHWIAARREFFTTDAVWHVLKRDFADAGTHEPRAMGPIMRRAQTDGIVAPTDDYRPSVRPETHRNPKRVWRSLARVTEQEAA